MSGLGTAINAAAILVGGIIGVLCKKLIKESYQDTIIKATAISVMFIGAGGTFAKMLAVSGEGQTTLATTGTLTVVLSMVLGALVGEICDIDARFNQFGAWLKHKTGSDGDSQFINGFVTASLTVSIGAMGIMGAIQDGLYADYTTLVAKAVIDFVIILIMASSMGKGCIFSFIPVIVFQGMITALAVVLSGFLTDAVLDCLSMVGNILIFCVGLNLLRPNTIKVANLLPAIVVAVLLAFV